MCTYTCFILQACVFQMFITAFEKPRKTLMGAASKGKLKEKQGAAECRQWAGREDRADRRKSVWESQGRNTRTARTQHRKGGV